MAQMIQAIKCVRSHTGCGLIEGKKAVEEIRDAGYLADAPETEAAVQAVRQQHAREINALRVELDAAQRALGDARARATDAEVERDTVRAAFRAYVDGSAADALRAMLNLAPHSYDDERPY